MGITKPEDAHRIYVDAFNSGRHRSSVRRFIGSAQILTVETRRCRTHSPVYWPNAGRRVPGGRRVRIRAA
jgi:hypothetical protein